MTDQSEIELNRGFIQPTQYDITPLSGPVPVGHLEFVDRGFYKIKLVNQKSTESRNVIKSEYKIVFNLQHVPANKFLNVLKHCFTEIFYLIKYNPVVGQGTLFTRICFESECLKGKTLNLKAVPLNREGAKMVLFEIDKVLQSNENFLIDKDLYIRFISVKSDLLTSRLSALNNRVS